MEERAKLAGELSAAVQSAEPVPRSYTSASGVAMTSQVNNKDALAMK